VIAKSLLIILGATVIFWSDTPLAHGQKATEIFIPVGQSPGLSNRVTVIGTIEGIDAPRRTLAITGPSGTWRATITDRTQIWMDRSKLRLTNQNGTFAYLRKGLLVEVKYEDPEGRSKGQGSAEWIKVQITEPGSAGSGPRP
jgi:hypothetical protein